MTSWQILISDPIAPEGVALLASRARILEGPPEQHQGEFDALIVRSATKVTGELLQACTPRLKVIGRAGVGVDNIDLATAQRLGVRMVNAPEATSTAVAEHAVALMLSLSRQIPNATAQMRAGKWPKKEFVGSELGDSTLGIIGLGRIGIEVARRAAAFEMTVLSFDPYLSEEQQARCGAEGCTLAELLERSDFITLHLPLTAETENIIGPEALEKIKPGARIVNTARGGLIDEAALLNALRDGSIAGAGLDVFDEEPPKNQELIDHPGVISTPHIAGQTVEAQRRVAVDIAEEVLAALEGKSLRWAVL